jgi:hypothetical protein
LAFMYCSSFLNFSPQLAVRGRFADASARPEIFHQRHASQQKSPLLKSC